ncbi:MAG: hypothetical protein PUE01_11665 [Clostridiaceae bacterium]|nr:hypothetical protein [Clostridiaceae bacterium]
MNYWILGLVGGLGFIISFIGYGAYRFEKKVKKNCNYTTIGHVVDYDIHGCAATPIVEYTVKGQAFRARKFFKSTIKYKDKFLIGKDCTQKYDIYLDDKDVLHINEGMEMSCREAIEKVCPIGTEYKVYYNPDSAYQASVDTEPQHVVMRGKSVLRVGLIIMAIGIGLSLVFGK